MKTVFLRVLGAENKAAALLDAVRGAGSSGRWQRFEVDPHSFNNVPRSPFAYWVSDRLRQLFKEFESFEMQGGTARQGLATTDDFRFVRTWWEVPPQHFGLHWFPFAKGGRFSPFYADLDLVVDWAEGGREMYAFTGIPFGMSGAPMRNPQYYFRPGLTWPLRTHKFCPQVMPSGVIISVRGSGIYCDRPELFLGLFSSQVADQLMKLQSGKDAHPQFDMGDVSQLPVPVVGPDEEAVFAALSRRAWRIKRTLDSRTETSHAFSLPVLLQVDGENCRIRASGWFERVSAAHEELSLIQSEIDERSFDLYRIGGADRRAILEGIAGSAAPLSHAATEGVATSDSDGQEDEDKAGGDAASLASELVAWAFGVAVGRFDVRLAMGDRPMPPEPEPFDPLPICSPGMVYGEDGLPLSGAPTGYPLMFPEDGILVDDPGHPRDLTTAIRAVFDLVFGTRADAWWNDVAALLDPQEYELRSWLAAGCFEHHLKWYSRSHRNAPILWQLGTPSSRYSVWLYAHRLTGDSLFQLQNDVVGPKLAHEERRLVNLVQQAGGNPSAGQRRDIDEQDRFVSELRAMLDEIKRAASLWSPNLDDGVVITMAPLWRLVPQHREWQTELLTKWNELCGGKYDWSHIAMHLWPERVVAKSQVDRSLAIAHGLEEKFWQEVTNGKWQRREVDDITVDKLAADRTSQAVKAALESLLHATAPLSSRGTARIGTTRAAASLPRRAPAITASSRDASASQRGSAPDAALLDAVRETIAARNGASKADVLAATGISDGEWSAAIKTLLAAGAVTQTGERRGARYHLVGGDA